MHTPSRSHHDDVQPKSPRRLWPKRALARLDPSSAGSQEEAHYVAQDSDKVSTFPPHLERGRLYWSSTVRAPCLQAPPQDSDADSAQHVDDTKNFKSNKATTIKAPADTAKCTTKKDGKISLTNDSLSQVGIMKDWLNGAGILESVSQAVVTYEWCSSPAAECSNRQRATHWSR